MTAGPEMSLSEQKPAPRQHRYFFGWYLVAAGAAIQMLAGALLQQTFGAYAERLHSEFGWSRGAIGAAFSFSRVESGLLGPVQGWMIDRFGPQVVMRVGLTIFALSFLAFSQINSLLMFFITFGLMSLGASLGGFMSITVAVVNWFDRYRARALGISSAGFAVGGLLAPVVILSITRFGWRETAFASGVIILIVGLPLTHFVRRRPEEMGLTVDGHSEHEVEALRERDRREQRVNTSTEVDFTAREALRTRAFWMISGGHGTALLVVSAVMVHLFLHLTDTYGYSDVQAAGFIFLMTGMQVVGQLLGGFLGDLVSKRLIVTLNMLMHAAGLLLITYSGALLAVIGFCVLHGSAWGMRGPLMQALRADYFGRSSFGTIMGFSSMVIMLGTMTGPVLAGFLYDLTESYRPGFTIISALAAMGSVFFILASRPALPQRALEARAQAAEQRAGATADGDD